MKIICIGDSLTFGYPFGEKYSWPNLLSERNGWEMLNFGENGQVSRDILERVAKNAYFYDQGSAYGSENSADKAIIMCGSNDFIYGTCSLLETLANILQMALSSRNAGIEPLVVMPILCKPEQANESWVEGTDYDKVNEDLTILGEKLQEACKDFGFEFLNLQDEYANYNQYEDGLHPTEEGYQLIADLIEGKLKG